MEDLDAVIREHVANLEAALLTSRRIGAAVGILMGRHQITGEDVFAMLTSVSQNDNRKVRDLADHLVEYGELKRCPHAS